MANEIIELGQKHAEIRNNLPRYTLEELLEFAFIEAVKEFYLNPENITPAILLSRAWIFA